MIAIPAVAFAAVLMAARSPLQDRIDAARAGERVVVAAGTYDGELVIDRSIALVAAGRVVLRGSGTGTVVSIVAPDVTIDGIEVDGLGGGDLGRDASGIHVAAARATIRNCIVRESLFGIYLRAADGSRVEGCRVYGVKGKAAGEKGSGIHIWNTDGFTLTGNEVSDVRDGVYIQSSPHGVIRGNRARDLRYGLHYMFSDDNLFEDNVFENGDAGTAIMYSRRLTFRRNQFLRNRGFASVGLLLKSCDDVLAEHNLIADNARGVFLEGSARNVIRNNVIAQSDIALVIFASTSESAILGNSFVGNLAPLAMVGRRTDTRIEGNYWSDHDAPDLDGDGRADQPYRLSSLFDHLRGNLIAADLFARSLSASALGAAERALPVLDPIQVLDVAPLARPPALPVPIQTRREGRAAAGGLLVSASALALGVAVLAGGGRRRPGRRGARSRS